MAANRTWTLAGGLSCVLITSRSSAVKDRVLGPGVLEHGRLHRCPGRDSELLIDRELGRLPLDHRLDERYAASSQRFIHPLLQSLHTARMV